MTDDDKKQKRPNVNDSAFNRAESYAFCATHNRRYPQGAMCPNCVAELKKKG